MRTVLNPYRKGDQDLENDQQLWELDKACMKIFKQIATKLMFIVITSLVAISIALMAKLPVYTWLAVGILGATLSVLSMRNLSVGIALFDRANTRATYLKNETGMA